MTNKCLAILCLVVIQGAQAAVNIRGSTESHQLQSSDVSMSEKRRAPINWTQVGMGAGIGALVVGAIIGGMIFAGRKTEDAKEGVEDTTAAEPLLAEPEADDKAVDYAALLKALSQKVTDQVSDKSDGVSNVLQGRMTSFQDKAKNFLLSEMNGTADAVMKELRAEESMLMLEWDHAVDSNFPPPSILLAGVLSPTVINFMSFHHFLQMVTVGLPLLVLCVAALYIDHGAPCAIPTIFSWLYTQTVLAFLLFVGHGILLWNLSAGKKSLQTKRNEVEENLKGTEEGGFSNMKEQFIGNTIILQEALIVENRVRHSIWNTIVGVATVLWLLCTVWNLVLIARYTFVPGIIAFHPDAAKVAKDDFCGAWATVLVLRISILLSVLYLFLNLATVVHWFCDQLIGSSAFSNGVLSQARKLDKNGTGLPVVETLVKAFLLRGGDESIISQLSVAQHHKKFLENQQAGLQSKLNTLNYKIDCTVQQENELTEKAKDGGDLAAQVKKLNSDSVDYNSWKTQGSAAIEAAEAKVTAMGAAKTAALEEIYEDINYVIEEVKNSEGFKEAQRMAEEAAEQMQAKMNEAMEMVNSPEFRAQVQALADKAQAQATELAGQAQGLADEAIKYAKDPKNQEMLQNAAASAMKNAQDLAKSAADNAQKAVNDPELQAKLKDAMEQAQAAAMKAAEDIQDPKLQKQMRDNAKKALEQAKAGAEAASTALLSDEFQQQMLDSAKKAMEEAQAAVEQGGDVAMQKLKEAQETAEKAAAIAKDPALKLQFEKQAKEAVEQAKALAAAAQEQGEKAKAAAQEQGEKAAAAAKEAGEKAKEQADKASAAVKEAGETAKAAATEQAGKVKEQVDKAAAKAKEPVVKAAADYQLPGAK